jgi:large subunit ribosomal protein L17
MSRKHRAKNIKLGRNHNQRKALIRQQLNALIDNGFLVTTETKAKVIKRAFDKIAAKAASSSLHKTRQVISRLANSANALKLTQTISPLAGDRRGGYVKISKLNPRPGDNAPLAKLELTVPLPKVEKKTEKVKTKKDTKSKIVKTSKMTSKPKTK